jgi:hypothetical protein
MARDGERIEAWAPVLRVYDAVAYACSTEVHFLMRDRDRALAEAREALATVASRYGFILPPSERGGT